MLVHPFFYKCFSIKEMIRMAVIGYVSTMRVNVNVRHMVRTMRNFSRCVIIFQNLLKVLKLWNDDFVGIRTCR